MKTNEPETSTIAGSPVNIACQASPPDCRATRMGHRLLRAGAFLGASEPFFALAMLALAMLIPGAETMAQTPTDNIFGSDQQVGNAIREAIKWGRNLLFLMGVVFVGWGVVNYGTEKPAAKQLIAAVGSFAFGGIVALIYSISQGTAVNFDTGFGN
ncbi:MAG: hypothetical protein ACKV2V_09725 [Blastocatellia bacterium]